MYLLWSGIPPNLTHILAVIFQAEPSSFQKVSVMITTCYAIGIGLYYSPYFTQTWSQMFYMTNDISYISLLTVVHVAGMSLPSYIKYVAASMYFVQLITNLPLVVCSDEKTDEGAS